MSDETQTVNGLTFKQWLHEVDVYMSGILMGITHNDIADWHWWDSWDSGDSPVEAAQDALRADDLFAMTFGEGAEIF